MVVGAHTMPRVFSAPLMLSFNRKLLNLTRLTSGPHSSSKCRLLADSPFIRRFTAIVSSVQDQSSRPKDTALTSTLRTRNFKRLSCNVPISTLDPSRLVEDDYIDFSLKACATLRVALQSCKSNDSSASPHLSPRAQFTAPSWSSHRFPPNTRGFMYYQVPPHSSPLAGELRFRLASSRDPASFATGADLLTDRAIPWRYPLYKMVCRESHQDIVSLLLQDGLVSQRTLDLVTAAVSSLSPSTAKRPRRRGGSEAALSALDARHPTLLPTTPVLSAFGQEFDLHYSSDLNFCAVFASQDAFLTHRLRRVISFRVKVEGKYLHLCPFRGSVVCCFERSTLPEHAGRRVVVIRIKRFIDSDPILDVPAPVNLDVSRRLQIERICPRMGELLMAPGHHGIVRPWTAEVDKVHTRRRTGDTVPRKALRVLFENEELYGPPREP